MDAFLATALAPKPKAKRKATPLANGQDSSSTTGRNSSSDAAKRLRPRGDSLMDEAKTGTDRTKTPTTAAPAAVVQPATSQAAPLPSFLATVTGQGVSKGTSRTLELLEKAEKAESNGRLEQARLLLTRALVVCVCHAQLRNHFKGAGASLDAIDPIGQCSCRDFVAAAQTRRKQTMLTVMMGGATSSLEDDEPFSITELDLEAMYGMATNSVCTCGSGRIRCAEPDHLKALDRLTAITSKLGRAAEAIRLAQWYVDLAPQHAQGYLRLAKAVMAKAAPKSMDIRSKDDIKKDGERARFAARCLYTHGLHNVRKHGNESDDMLRLLRRCIRQYSHGDYLPDLPVETVEGIFQNLSMNDILACRRVSKRWALVMRRVRLCPSQIRFAGDKEHSTKGLQNLLRQFPGLQTGHLAIIYPNSVNAAKSAQFVTAALRHFQSTESLELHMWNFESESSGGNAGPRSTVTHDSGKITIQASLGPPPLPSLPAVSKCRRLVLHNTRGHESSPASFILVWASQSLESLTLDGAFFTSDFGFQLPRLRHLQITGSTWCSRRTEFGFTRQILTSSMQIEQLYLDNIAFYASRSREDDLVETLEENLQNLHTLVIGSNCTLHLQDRTNYPGAFLAFPRLPPGMRCIDILSDMETLAYPFLFGGHYNYRHSALSLDDFRPFEYLEYFRCLGPVHHPEHIFQLIGPSLSGSNGRLAHLELNAQNIPVQFLDNKMSSMRVPYPERLRTIGLHLFNWSSLAGMGGGSSSSMLRDRVFIDWVALFPNIETVCMNPAWSLQNWSYDGGEGGRLVVALVEQTIRKAEADAKAEGSSEPESIIKHLRLRKIYQTTLHGATRDLAKKLIGNRPIQIHNTSLRPPVFPWPDRVEEDRDSGTAEL